MPSRPFRILAAMIASLSGCGTLANYELHVDELQKDVLRVRVNLPTPLSKADYRRLAHQELERVINLDRRFDTPLYEVEFEFYVPALDDGPARKAATYNWRLAPPPPSRPHLAVR